MVANRICKALSISGFVFVLPWFLHTHSHAQPPGVAEEYFRRGLARQNEG